MRAIPLSTSNSTTTSRTPHTTAFTVPVEIPLPGVLSDVAPWAPQIEGLVRVKGAMYVTVMLHVIAFVIVEEALGRAIKGLPDDQMVPGGKAGGFKSSTPEPLGDPSWGWN